jgi:hypothetical protein
MIHEEMSPSELLSAFLDGELPESETSSLFYSLAQNPELQVEMRQHLTLRSSVQSITHVVPAGLQDAIFLKGSALAGHAVAVSTGAAGGGVITKALTTFFKSRAAGMVFSGVLASLATYALLPNGESSTQAVNTGPSSASLAAATQITAAEATPVNVPTQILSERINASEEQLEKAYLDGFKKGIASASVQIAEEAAVEEDNSRNMKPMPENNGREMVTIGPDEVLKVPQTSYVKNSSPLDIFRFGATPWVPSEPKIPASYSVVLRGTAAYSFPHLNVPSSSDPAFNNMSIGFQYRVGINEEVGVEIGRENFQQQYNGTEEGKRYRYEQIYSAIWGGVSYQRALPSISSSLDVQPVFRATLGGTQVGPLAKVSAGLMYEYNDKIGMLASIEGTTLAYSYQNTIFTTKKLGFTYGFLFRF